MTAYLRLAADHGITVLLYPIDGWTIGRSFVPRSIDQCRRYGGRIAQRFADLPNIVWMSGGDYWYAYAAKDPARGTDLDRCIDAMMRGIREAGDGRPFSVQLNAEKSISTDIPYQAGRLELRLHLLPDLQGRARCPPAPAGDPGGARRGQLRRRE